MKKILITGGAGFIGSHVVRLFVNKYPDYQIFNLDKLTYAGNLFNLKDIESKPNYHFIKADIVDGEAIHALFQEHRFDGVIHLAAESHVDRSIANPMEFVMTNVIGTVNLLNAARHLWKDNFEGKRFYHISTDEVYGSLGETGFFYEDTAYDPHSPTLHPKPAATILCVPITTPLDCRWWFRTAPTIMGQTSFRKNSFRCLSTISVTTNPCRFTAKAKTCATGCMWLTMHAPLM